MACCCYTNELSNEQEEFNTLSINHLKCMMINYISQIEFELGEQASKIKTSENIRIYQKLKNHSTQQFNTRAFAIKLNKIQKN